MSHHCDEARGLARRLDVERSGPLLRLVGDDADGAAVEAAERGDEVRGVLRRAARGSESSSTTSAIDRAHVVGRRRACRAPRPPPVRSTAVDGVVGRAPAAGRRGGGRGGRRGSSSSASRACVLVVDDERGDAAPRVVHAAPPSSVAVTCTPVKSATASGPVTNANASSVITTWSSSPSASAGPDTHAPVTASRVGTTPETRRDSRGELAPRVERGDVLAQLGARGVDLADERDAQLAGEAHRPLDGLAAAARRSRRGASRRRCGTTRPAGRRPRAAPPMPRRRRRRGSASSPRVGARISCRAVTTSERRSAWRCGRRTRTSSTAPARASIARGAPATTSRWMSSPSCSRFAVGGTMPSRIASSAGDGFGRAGGADQVPGDALGRRDRRRGVAEHLADRLGLGRVVERGRRAVRVDVPDLARAKAGVVERELHARRRAFAAGRRRGDVVRVGVAAVAGDLAVDRRAARARARSSGSSTSAAAPSPMTKPSRSASNGRDACSGSSLRVAERGHARERGDRRAGVSTPRCRRRSRRRRCRRGCSRAASPIACALAAHAVEMQRFGPVQPNCIATVPAVAFVIIIGTKNGLTRAGALLEVDRDLVLERDEPADAGAGDHGARGRDRRPRRPRRRGRRPRPRSRAA